MIKSLSLVTIILGVLVFSSPADAQPVITEGFTFSVASDPGDTSVGTHFHSSTGGDFGNPAGKAEVGSYFDEEVRGLSEYDLAGLVNSDAFVTFEVFLLAGLFVGQNDFPFDGDIDIVAYMGDNLELISDYEAASIGAVGTFNTTGLVVGQTLSFDITGIYNSAVDNGDSSLGIRLQIADGTVTDGGAITFDNFRLTSEPIPEPSAMAGLVSGLLLLCLSRRRR